MFSINDLFMYMIYTSKATQEKTNEWNENLL